MSLSQWIWYVLEFAYDNLVWCLATTRSHLICVYETLSLQANAMGTFNILNGEDRMVAAALILPEKKDDDDEQ